MSEQEIYSRFIDWMKQSAWGMPETEVMESLVKALYAPEDASLLTGMPFLPKKIAALAELKQMPAEELSAKLDALAKKGLVFRFLKDGTVYYNLFEFIYAQNPSFMNERTDNDIRKLASLVNQNYYSGGWDLSNEIKMKTLRAIPIKATIDDPRQILPYEDVAAIFDSLDYFCLSPCSCKKMKNLDPDYPNCEHPVEVCFHFGQIGRYFAENGMGREVSRKEAENILQQCAELGLVHAVSNVKNGVNILCNCCKCCCVCLQAVHRLKHAKGMHSSSYIAVTNQETCKGCGLCVQRCQMKARRLENVPLSTGSETGKVAVINQEMCIGCGVCAYKCPTQSIMMKRKEVFQEPPLNPIEHGQMIMADLQAARVKGR